jgi:hypothetical protein
MNRRMIEGPSKKDRRNEGVTRELLGSNQQVGRKLYVGNLKRT